VWQPSLLARGRGSGSEYRTSGLPLSQHGASYGPSSVPTAPATAASASASIRRPAVSLNEHLEHDDGEASMVTHKYRVTEAADGTFPVELWSSQRDRSQLIYKTRGFQSRELAEAWIVPVEDRSGDPPSPRSRVIYLKPRSSTFNP